MPVLPVVSPLMGYVSRDFFRIFGIDDYQAVSQIVVLVVYQVFLVQRPVVHSPRVAGVIGEDYFGHDQRPIYLANPV